MTNTPYSHEKQIRITGLLILIAIQYYSQIVFEKGYFINESNQEIACLIKNKDWKNNPTQFEYKITQDSNIQKADIGNVKEFGINGISKYIRATVQIDLSGNKINKMSIEKNPVFQEKELFLRILIEGKASLLFYEKGNLKRYFYNLNDSEIQQLVYKPYLIDNKIGKNNHFRQQLFLNLKCQVITRNDVEHLVYYKKDLERFFIKYNECSSADYINYDSKQKKDLFNLSIRPGLNYSNLTIRNLNSYLWGTKLSNKHNLRIGLEAEMILPFNKNKWAIIIEPTYQYFNSEKHKTISNSTTTAILVSKVDYKSIELPMGLRHYLYLKNDSKIFANISYIYDFNKNSSAKFSKDNGSVISTLEIGSNVNLALGIGFKYKERYALEFRYLTNRELLGDYLVWNSNYSTFSIIFGYSLF